MSEPDWWELAAAELAAVGVRRVFGLPGDDMLAVRAFAGRGLELRTLHEQRTAVHAATAWARLTDEPAVVVLGRGPGVAAAVPALLEARTSNVPVLVLTGGVPMGRTDGRAFQSAPQRDLLAPVVDQVHRIEVADQVRPAVRRAVYLTRCVPGRSTVLELPDPGPGTEPVTGPVPSGRVPPLARSVPIRAASAPLPVEVTRARRVVVLVGGGCRGAGPAVVAFADALGATLICTASGRGVVDEDHPRFLGLAGLYLHPAARRHLAEADLLVALGTRLEETAVEHLDDALTTVQVNLDPGDLVVSRPGALVAAEVGTALRDWTTRLAVQPEHDPWRRAAEQVRAELEAWARSRAPGPAGPSVAGVLRTLAELLPTECVVCHENGLFDIWSYLVPVFALPAGAAALVPSEQTTLGAGCAAALGVPDDRLAVVITGDGAWSTVLGEMTDRETAGRRVLYLVFADGGYGWLEQQNRAVTGEVGRFAGRTDLLLPPGATVVQDRSRIRDVLTGALEHAGRGRGIQVVVVPVSADEAPPVLANEW